MFSKFKEQLPPSAQKKISCSQGRSEYSVLVDEPTLMTTINTNTSQKKN